MKHYLLLITVILIQSAALSAFSVYTLHVQLFWALFTLTVFFLKPALTPLIATVAGWLLAVVTGDNTLLLAGFGFVTGCILSLIVQRPIWSLTWVRVVSALTITIIYEFMSICTIIGLAETSFIQVLLFVVVHAVVIVALSIYIKEPRYE